MICTMCTTDKPVEAFTINRSRSIGRTWRCRECDNAYKRERNHAIKAGTWVPWKKGRCGQNYNTIKASKSPTLRDLSWAAGFIEGEGSFGNGAVRTNTVRAAQLQREPLERLQAMFGGNIYFTRSVSRAYEISTWSASGSRARGVMMTLFPMMSPRRKEQIRTELSRTAQHGVAL